MNKVIRLSLVAVAMCWFVRLAGAQSGCVNSPENPTAVLALIGASGYAVRSLMSRFAKKRK